MRHHIERLSRSLSSGDRAVLFLSLFVLLSNSALCQFPFRLVYDGTSNGLHIDGQYTDLAWSADSRQLAFSAYTTEGAFYDIYVVDVVSGESHVVVQDYSFKYVRFWSWSRDKIVYASSRDGDPLTAIRRVRSDSSDPETVQLSMSHGANLFSYSDLSCSALGDTLIFSADHSIARYDLNVENSDTIISSTASSNPNFKGNDLIAFVSWNVYPTLEICTMDKSGGHITRVTSTDDVNEGWPTISADGHYIAYISIQFDGSNARLMVSNLITGEVIMVSDSTALMTIFTRPCWSTDGRSIAVVDNSGDFSKIGVFDVSTILPLSDDPANSPTHFSLHPIYPNPFNNTANIVFDLPREVTGRLVVYDMLGRVANTLHDGRLLAGTHLMQFDGNAMSSGTYFVKLETPDFNAVQKAVLVK